MLLLGDTATVRAGRDYTIQALKLEREAHQQPVDQERWSARVQMVERARALFHEAARNDLGVRAQGFTDEMWSWYPPSEPDRDEDILRETLMKRV